MNDRLQTLTDLLHEGLNLCVRGRNLDKAISEIAARDAYPKSAAAYPEAFPVSMTPHLWVQEQYDTDLAEWEKRAREALAER